MALFSSRETLKSNCSLRPQELDIILRSELNIKFYQIQLHLIFNSGDSDEDSLKLVIIRQPFPAVYTKKARFSDSVNNGSFHLALLRSPHIGVSELSEITVSDHGLQLFRSGKGASAQSDRHLLVPFYLLSHTSFSFSFSFSFPSSLCFSFSFPFSFSLRLSGCLRIKQPSHGFRIAHRRLPLYQMSLPSSVSPSLRFSWKAQIRQVLP